MVYGESERHKFIRESCKICKKVKDPAKCAHTGKQDKCYIKFLEKKGKLTAPISEYKAALRDLLSFRCQIENDISGKACIELDRIIKCLNA